MSTMIKIRIKNADHEIDIRFPISESELFAKLGEIHAVEGRDAAQSALVTDVYWPEEFSMLKDRFANLDELNYLGKRMESFDYHEYDQFLIGITKLENPTEKDLINLTFNLDHFTLCKDVSSYLVIGGAYSVDKYYRLSRGWGWWPDEQPSPEIKTFVEQQIKSKPFDIVLSHTCPFKYEPTEMFLGGIDQSTVDDSTERWLDTIEEAIEYKAWFCGHWHTDKRIDKMHFLFHSFESDEQFKQSMED